VTELLLHERQSLIRRRLASDGRVIAAELAQEFSISEDTIRRDLREMAAAGLCRRVYGGALPADGGGDTSLLGRLAIKPERKDALARAAVDRFRPGMTVFIDAGTTNLAIAQAIPADMAMTLITNAPVVAASLLDRRELGIVMIGGQLDRASGAILGSRAMQDAASFHPDLCVLGSCGLDAETGVTASFCEEADFKRFIAQRSRAVMAAVTNEKLGVPAPFAVVPLDARSEIVVEHDADPRLLASIAATGALLVKAGVV
jgi:DeoR/GlpR family transcriptional regulator of sugar metabolism